MPHINEFGEVIDLTYWTTEVLTVLALNTSRSMNDRWAASEEIRRRGGFVAPTSEVSSRHIFDVEGYLICYRDGTHVMMPWNSAP